MLPITTVNHTIRDRVNLVSLDLLVSHRFDAPSSTHCTRHSPVALIRAFLWRFWVFGANHLKQACHNLILACGLGLLPVAMIGCIPIPYWNPDFPASRELVSAEIRRMLDGHVERPRPLVILSGYRSPRFAADLLGSRLQRLAHIRDDQLLVMSYPCSTSIPGLARRAVERVEQRWPSANPDWTTEVDVIGYSMGGIVARLAATGPMVCSCSDSCESCACDKGKRLRIHTLYTLATPHNGAALADIATTSSAVRDMTRGSALQAFLDDALTRKDYKLVCYAVLEDKIVDARRTYPDGYLPYWVSGWIVFSHFQIVWDRRVVADIALRLRNETPISIRPSLPPRHE